MAEEDFQEKTEEPTEKRLADARQEGNVARSQEVNSVAILLTSFILFYYFSGDFVDKLANGFRIYYRNFAQMDVSAAGFLYYSKIGIKSFITLLAPLLLALAAVGIGANLAQVGFLWTFKPLKPKFSALNPLKGIKKLFSLSSLVEFIKSSGKVLIIGVIAYQTLRTHQHEYLKLVHTEIITILNFLGKVLFQIAMKVIACLVVLAILDYLYKRWDNKKKLKMSKSSVKGEHRAAEGDPDVKGQMKSMRAMLRRERMMDKVPEADVVITNPTQLAIALKYNPDDMSAPLVLAKGARLLAQKIKEIAREHNIPIIENKPLAQSLFKLCDVGSQIPFELFQAVAEVFAQVFQVQQKRA